MQLPSFSLKLISLSSTSMQLPWFRLENCLMLFISPDGPAPSVIQWSLNKQCEKYFCYGSRTEMIFSAYSCVAAVNRTSSKCRDANSRNCSRPRRLKAVNRLDEYVFVFITNEKPPAVDDYDVMAVAYSERITCTRVSSRSRIRVI